VQVALLGPLRVSVEGQAVALGAAKERAVLAVLALRGGRAAGIEELTGALWGDAPPRSAHKTLQSYVSELRRVLPDGVIQTVPGGYRLCLAAEDIDVAVFERLVASGRRALAEGDPHRAVDCLAEGLGLWRGDPLVELADQAAGVTETARLVELRRSADEELAEARLDLGEHAALVGDLDAAVAAEPLRERRWAQLMIALFRCGRQADALRTYQRLRTTLSEELGIEPSAELRALEDAILLQKPELDWQRSFNHDRSSAGRTSAVFMATQPALLAELSHRAMVGRQTERMLLHTAWHEARSTGKRCVLIQGEAGSGKSRLLADLADEAIAEGALVLAGRCDEGASVPYQPIAEAIRGILRATPESSSRS
jgi:DNA-binding SARP family transcriptional activator